MEVCDIVSVAGDNRVMGRKNISIFFSVMIRVEKIDKKPKENIHVLKSLKISEKKYTNLKTD
jgi:activator of HSP90 ATPase